MLRDFGLPELLIILVIVIVLFGPGRIGKVAGELGKGIRSFKEGLDGKDDAEKKAEEKAESEKQADTQEKTPDK
jgi:sec-independent protein translocase protein TatA